MVMGVVRVLFWFVFWWFGFGFLLVLFIGWFLGAIFSILNMKESPGKQLMKYLNF